MIERILQAQFTTNSGTFITTLSTTPVAQRAPGAFVAQVAPGAFVAQVAPHEEHE